MKSTKWSLELLKKEKKSLMFQTHDSSQYEILGILLETGSLSHYSLSLLFLCNESE